MGIAHWDEVKKRPRALGHLQGSWTFLGEAVGCSGVGVRRIEVPAGGWSTPAHEHGREEEIFFVLAGRGLSWEDGETFEIGPGDCVGLSGRAGRAHPARDRGSRRARLRASPRRRVAGFPRTGLSIVGARIVESTPGFYDGYPAQFHAEAAAGPPELPAQPAPRPATIVNLADVEPNRESRGEFAGPWRDLGRAAGSVRTGLKHIHVPPGKLSCPQHCHGARRRSS